MTHYTTENMHVVRGRPTASGRSESARACDGRATGGRRVKEHTTAIISKCKNYRYALARTWGGGPQALFIMLNPSTADHTEDDPTIRRCRAFARREGCGSLRVENLFAWRATDPNKLPLLDNIAKGRTDRHIVEAVAACDGPLILGWGSNPAAKRRAFYVTSYLIEGGAIPMCLGTTKDGSPRHPLYVKASTPLEGYIP